MKKEQLTPTTYQKRDRVVTPDGLGHVVHVYHAKSVQPEQSAYAVKVNGTPKTYSGNELRPAMPKDFKKGKAVLVRNADKTWDYKLIQKNGNQLTHTRQGYRNRVDMIDVLNNNFIDFEIVRI